MNAQDQDRFHRAQANVALAFASGREPGEPLTLTQRKALAAYNEVQRDAIHHIERDPIHRSPRAQQRIAKSDWLETVNRDAQRNVENRFRRSESRPTVPAWLSGLGLYSFGVVTGALTVIFAAGWL